MQQELFDMIGDVGQCEQRGRWAVRAVGWASLLLLRLKERERQNERASAAGHFLYHFVPPINLFIIVSHARERRAICIGHRVRTAVRAESVYSAKVRGRVIDWSGADYAMLSDWEL